MATAARALDDHPFLTARHVDDLTSAVRGLTTVLVRVEPSLSKVANLLERLIEPKRETPPMPAPPPRPTAAGVSSARATTAPQRRKGPRG